MTSTMRCMAIAVLVMVSPGCRFFGARVKPDPAPLPAPPRPVEEVKAPAPKVEPPGPPPKIETKAPEVPATVANLPKPPAPRPKRRPQKKTIPTAVGTAATVQPAPSMKDPQTVEVAPAPVEPPSLPKLGEIFSDDQKLQLQKSCDESITRAKEALGQLRGLSLSPDQKQSLARVHIFISQAQQAKSKDPQTAKQLAERADLLSRDLVRTVR